MDIEALVWIVFFCPVKTISTETALKEMSKLSGFPCATYLHRITVQVGKVWNHANEQACLINFELKCREIENDYCQRKHT